MAAHKFTATHGVNLADLGVHFEFDAEATGTSSEKVYSLTTEDADTAKALRSLDRYGITEVKSKQSK